MTSKRFHFPLRDARCAILISMLLAWGTLGSSITRAGIVTYDGLQVDIQESFGSGPNQTMLVVDWKSGTPPSFAWLFSWSDPSTTMDDALNEIQASEPSDFQYHAPEGYVVELNYFDGTNWYLGNTEGFMSIWDSPGTGNGPAFHLNGGVDTTLIAGGWAGINAAGVNPPEFSYPGQPPVVPTAAAVPEPGSLVMISLGFIGLAGFVWRGRRATGLAACLFLGGLAIDARAGTYDPQVGQTGSLGIPNTSPLINEWASSIVSITRGPEDIADPNSPLASFGDPSNALGIANGVSAHVVSLGDGGSITLSFNAPIANGLGADFAVFENGFLSGGPGLAYLELAFVDVSSDGAHFFRFPSVTETQTTTQIGGFGSIDATNLHDLAGKYVAGYGTGFDLSELTGISPYLNVNDVTEVRITDVVGSIDPQYGTRDSLGNLINDPFPSPFASSGFDLNGVGVINVASVPEPSSLVLGLAGIGIVLVASPRVKGGFPGRCPPLRNQ